MGKKGLKTLKRKSILVFIAVVFSVALLIWFYLGETVDGSHEYNQIHIMQSKLNVTTKQLEELKLKNNRLQQLANDYQSKYIEIKEEHALNQQNEQHSNNINNIQLNKEINVNNSTRKIIWILWFQGWDKAPLISQICLKSWKYFNDKNWLIIPLDSNNLPFYMETYDFYRSKLYNSYGWQGLSDIVRIELLNKYGGVWVDSTVFCTESLNNWLSKYVNNNGFFAFDKPGGNRLLSSWFLTSSYNNSYIIKKWNENVHLFYETNLAMRQYYWFHNIFRNLYNSDQIFKQKYDQVSKISANEPHVLIFAAKKRGWFGIQTKTAIKHIDQHKSPMYKLDKSIDLENNEITLESNLGYLLNKYQYIITKCKKNETINFCTWKSSL